MRQQHLIANISWNENKWKIPSNFNYKSGFIKVKDGTWANESYNFDFNHPTRSDKEYIYGFFKTTNSPIKFNNDNIVFFASKNTENGQTLIVGIYERVELSKKYLFPEVTNLKASKEFSVLFDNFIPLDNNKYLDGKKRIGQIGFNYISNEAAKNIINKAIEIHKNKPTVLEKINKIKTFYFG